MKTERTEDSTIMANRTGTKRLRYAITVTSNLRKHLRYKIALSVIHWNFVFPLLRLFIDDWKVLLPTVLMINLSYVDWLSLERVPFDD